MVPVGGLEPPRSKATDFESVVYTNFTIPAFYAIQRLVVGMGGIIPMLVLLAIAKVIISLNRSAKAFDC